MQAAREACDQPFDRSRGSGRVHATFSANRSGLQRDSGLCRRRRLHTVGSLLSVRRRRRRGFVTGHCGGHAAMSSTGSVGIVRIIPTSPLTTQRLALREHSGAERARYQSRLPTALPCRAGARRPPDLAATESQDSAALRVVRAGSPHRYRSCGKPLRSRFHARRRKSSRRIDSRAGRQSADYHASDTMAQGRTADPKHRGTPRQFT